jgi:UDP-glucose 4-epimerase
MGKVLITGVAGFMGSHLADDFIKQGYRVSGIDNFVGGYEENIPPHVEFHYADLGNFDSIKDLFYDVDLVVHAACTAYEGLSVFSPALVTRNTSHITTTVLSASVRNHVKKFVYMSSMSRYGTQDTLPFTEEMIPKPQDPYGIAKYASELLVKNICTTHGMKYVIVVPHNIIGPRQKYDDPYRNVASIMINRMLQGKPPIIYGDGLQKRCFSFWEDVARPLLTTCVTDSVDGEVVNVGPDEEYITINELAERLSSIMNFTQKPIFLPERPQEVRFANCSADKARKLIGYKTQTSLNDGLRKLVEWIELKGAKPFNYHLPLEFITPLTPKTWSEKMMND